MRKLVLPVLLAAFAVLLTASPAAASDASDAYKRARDLAKKVDRAGSDAERVTAQRDLETFVKSKTKILSGKELSKMDTAYFGKMQHTGGMNAEAVATLKRAVDHSGKTKYLSTIYNWYCSALVDAEKPDEAVAALKAMAEKFAADKNTSATAMTVGMALRRQKQWDGSATAFGFALKNKKTAALKPMVNSLLLAGKKAAAIETIEWAIKASGDMVDPGHVTLLEITKKIGEPIALDFAAFVPGDAPDLSGKVVVMGFWNVSSASMKWTMGFLTSVFNRFPPKDGCIPLAVTTYYKKNPDTGKIEEEMPAVLEHEIGDSYRTQNNFPGQLAYTKDRDGLKALGLTGLPYVVVVGKDGKLVYAHTIADRKHPAEVEVIYDIIDKALRE